jgi:hypothetical protein
LPPPSQARLQARLQSYLPPQAAPRPPAPFQPGKAQTARPARPPLLGGALQAKAAAKPPGQLPARPPARAPDGLVPLVAPIGPAGRAGGRASVLVQARLALRGGSKKELAEAIARTGIIAPERVKRLRSDLGDMIDSAEHFGEVDVHNEQQVELLAYRLAKGRFKRAAARDRGGVYTLAIIGAGSTAAYYIDTLGPAHDHSGTVVIGGENPWKEQRGHGIAYINHTSRQIALPSQNVAKYGGNESFVPRGQFARGADAAIKRAGGRWIKSNGVSKVRLLESGVYQIDYAEGKQQVLASKVIFAAGAGPARTPPEVKAATLENVGKIIDMNAFIRSKAKAGPKGRVVIWGSNAAIDAVAAAKRNGWTVVKWLYSSRATPTWLPGTRYKSKPYSLHKVPQHVYTGRDDIKIEDDGAQLKVMDKKVLVADKIDFVVYGMGSEDLLSGDNSILDDSVLGAPDEGSEKATLHPILDDAGRFGERDAPDGQRAFLGWKNRQGGFQVFGLAAENYEGNGGRINSALDPRVQTLKDWVSGDVATVGQLTYIRSAVRAANNYVPGSISQRVDYSHADSNLLFIHIAAKYPRFEPYPWYPQHFIEMLRTVRTGLGDRLPHGFTAEQGAFLDQQLAAKHQQIAGAGSHSEGDARNWCQWMSSRLRKMTPSHGAEVARGLARLPAKQR